MTIKQRIQSLTKLLKKAGEIKIENHTNEEFKIWKILAERTLIKVYGSQSIEVDEFRKLKFFFNPTISFLDDDHSKEHLKCFRKDLDLAKKSISLYIEELKEEDDEHLNKEQSIIDVNTKKVFISHSSKDIVFVEEIIDLIETIGLNSTQIFCSSFDGYGINLGENFLKRIKEELNEEVLVIFILSSNFYSSPVCLCEMGATWVKTNEHIPILIPPFEFKDIKGVIPMTQGFEIDQKLKINLFKEKLEKAFDLPGLDNSSWERKRNRILKRIEFEIERIRTKH